ncbi:MAG: hypothetical protein IJK89_01480 [Clostridia bacterium]|nr:hypothetical protein [Clostridia bacterium]
MKSQFKKALSCLLALALLCVAFLPCLAAAEAETVPEIFVPGFMGSTIYADVDDPDQGTVWPPKTDDILNMVKESLPALTRYMFDRDGDRLCDEVIPKVNALFEPVELDEDGNPKGNSGAILTYPEADKVTKDGVYTFSYDWRIDPLQVAEQLNDFIGYICECAGSDKVAVECHSYGGVVTLSYITLFGSEKLKSVVFNSTAVFGESFNGGLLSGQMTLSGDAIVKYMRYAFNDNDYEKLLNGIFEILGKAGLLDLVCDQGNRLVADLSPRVVPESIAPLFAGWLSVWAMIPEEFLDGAMKYVFEECYSDGSHRVLKEKVERFNTTVRPYKTETLTALNEAVNMYVIARYGWSSLPLTPYYNNQSDGSIDLKYASFGATCAEYEETLPDEYIAAADPEYISPDKSFDASTCLFPEQTWFVRDLTHSGSVAGFPEFVQTLLQSEQQETVGSLAGYSRFMLAENGALTADHGPAAKQTVLDKIRAFFQRIFDFFKNLFKK